MKEEKKNVINLFEKNTIRKISEEVLNERDKIKKKLYYKDLSGWSLLFSLSFAVSSLCYYFDNRFKILPNIDGLYLICFVSYASLILSYICYSEYKDQT